MPFDNSPMMPKPAGMDAWTTEITSASLPAEVMANYYPPAPPWVPTSQSCSCDQCRATYGFLRNPPALTPEVRGVLTQARALVAKGWGQGADKAINPRFFEPHHDPLYVYCTRGAVREAIGMPGTPLEREAMMRLAAFTPRMFDAGDYDGIVVRFNDYSNTTQADVVALFDRALA